MALAPGQDIRKASLVVKSATFSPLRSGELASRRVNGPELGVHTDPFDLAAQDASHVLGAGLLEECEFDAR